jgi:hypothetical protein
VVLSLVDKKGNQNPARLYLRVTQDSISAVAGHAVEQAQTSVKKLSRPLASNVADALLDTNKQSLVTSFDALLMHLKPLVKIGDEIAKVCSPVFLPVTIRINLFFRKIHPYVNFAWTVLSAGMKVS